MDKKARSAEWKASLVPGCAMLGKSSMRIRCFDDKDDDDEDAGLGVELEVVAILDGVSKESVEYVAARARNVWNFDEKDSLSK